MRELLFKAKRLSDGEWVEGYYVERDNKSWIYPAGNQVISKSLARELRPFHSAKSTQRIMKEVFPVDPSTVCQYTNIDTREECGEHFESNKIFTGDVLGEWTEDEDGNEYIGFFGIVTYWEDEGRYVLADENGLCNDWTLEDVAQPENWPNLIHCGSIHDGEGGQHEGNE